MPKRYEHLFEDMYAAVSAGRTDLYEVIHQVCKNVLPRPINWGGEHPEPVREEGFSVLQLMHHATEHVPKSVRVRDSQ